MTKMNWTPTTSELRAFGRGFAIIFGVVGLAKMFWPFEFGLTRDLQTGAMLIAIGLIGGGWALTGHKSARVLFVAWIGLGVVVGFFVSKILFAIVYFGLFTPMGLFFKFMGRDRLALKKPAADSYWHDLPLREGGYERLY